MSIGNFETCTSQGQSVAFEHLVTGTASPQDSLGEKQVSYPKKAPFGQPRFFIKTLPPCRTTSLHLLAILPPSTFHSTFSHGAGRRFFVRREKLCLKGARSVGSKYLTGFPVRIENYPFWRRGSDWSIQNYRESQQMTPLSTNSFLTNALFTCQNCDVCAGPRI